MVLRAKLQIISQNAKHNNHKYHTIPLLPRIILCLLEKSKLVVKNVR